jgi:carboxypeptidase C (cathepsin A)
MADEGTQGEKAGAKADHQPPAGAETSATWAGAGLSIDYTVRGNWIVLRKKERPAAEIFSVSYIAHLDRDRPVTFIFNGGPGASSAYLHMGAVGPSRVAFPVDGSLPQMPPRLVPNEESWLAFTDLVFVDPVGTGFSRIVEDEDEDAKKKENDQKKEQDDEASEYFGYKRDLESLCEFMSRWLSGNGRWGSPMFIAGESYGGYRVGRLVRMLQETAGIGLNGAVLISPAFEFGPLLPTDYDAVGWIDRLPTMTLAAVFHGRSRSQPALRLRKSAARRRRLRQANTPRFSRGGRRCHRSNASESSGDSAT